MKKSFPDMIISIVLLAFLTSLAVQVPQIPAVSNHNIFHKDYCSVLPDDRGISVPYEQDRIHCIYGCIYACFPDLSETEK